MSSDMELLVESNTRKILKLVQGLPDLANLDSSGGPSVTSSSRQKSRFTSHPRTCQLYERSDSDEEGNQCDFGANGDRSNEVLVLKDVCDKMGALDSSDELCDVTLRTEDFTGSMNSITSQHPLVDTSTSLESTACKPTIKFSNYRKALEEKLDREKALCMEPLPAATNAKATNSDLHRVAKEAIKQKPHPLQKCKRGDKYGRSLRETDELRIYVDSKMTSFVERSTRLLQDCKTILKSGIQPPDGYEDHERRKRRTNEFSTRFSRNYLYQLNRNVVEIEALINPVSTARAYKSTSALLLSQKFFTAFQTIALALEAYSKHLPTSLASGLPNKFRDLLTLVLRIDKLYHTVTDTEQDPEKDCVQVFSSQCQTMLSDDFLITQPRESKDGVSTNKSHGTKGKGKHHDSRLAMYEVPIRKDILWKQVIAEQAKKKYQVASKYKTATFKHRPPVTPAHAASAPPPPLKLNGRKASKPNVAETKDDSKTKKKVLLQSATLSLNDIDSNVTTLVEDTAFPYEIPSIVLPDLRSGARKQLRKHALGFYNKVTNDQNDMSEHEYECILRHFLGIIGEAPPIGGYSLEEATVMLLRKKLGVNIETLEFPDFVEMLVNYAEDNVPKARRQSTSVLPSKSIKEKAPKERAMSATSQAAQRIYEWLEEEEYEENARDLRAKSLPDIPSAELVYLECLDEDAEPVTRRPLRLRPFRPNARVPKEDLTTLAFLPKDVIIRIIEYKLEYQKHCKKNCMYSTSGAMSPWVIIERVGDALLEEILRSVAQDLQVDRILQKIYIDEFN